MSRNRKTNRAQKGSGFYTCRDCGQLTRESGDGESSIEMCANCYYLAGLENEHDNDEHVNNSHSDCVHCKQEKPMSRNRKKTASRKSDVTIESPFSSELGDLLGRIDSILSDGSLFWNDDGEFGVDATDLEWVDQLVEAAKLAKRYAKIQEADAKITEITEAKNAEIVDLIESIRETLNEDDD